MKPKFALMIYNANRDYNVGDYIQSLAAKQFLPRVDEYICRESLNIYKGPATKIILNGWFMDNPNWPPSPDLDPLFVSFHLNPHIQSQILNEAGVAYFNQHGPIGCRDPNTEKVLLDHNVPAYWTSCLTTTLDRSYRRTSHSNQIVFCDVLFKTPDYSEMLRSPRFALRMIRDGKMFQGKQRANLLQSLFADSVLQKATYVTHKYSRAESHERRFQRADELLRLYSQAKFVVTSRIHCALPCLAMGTPVLFIDSGFDDLTETSRLKGIIDLMNVIQVDVNGKRQERCNFLVPAKIDANVDFCNPSNHVEAANKLKSACDAFANNI